MPKVGLLGLGGFISGYESFHIRGQFIFGDILNCPTSLTFLNSILTNSKLF